MGVAPGTINIGIQRRSGEIGEIGEMGAPGPRSSDESACNWNDSARVNRTARQRIISKRRDTLADMSISSVSG
jgi:hypothetical protein